MKSQEFKKIIEKTHSEIINEILKIIKGIYKANEILLHHEITYNIIDDQASDYIEGINVKERSAIINYFDYSPKQNTILLKDLSSDILIMLLKEVENGKFEISEDYE